MKLRRMKKPPKIRMRHSHFFDLIVFHSINLSFFFFGFRPGDHLLVSKAYHSACWHCGAFPLFSLPKRRLCSFLLFTQYKKNFLCHLHIKKRAIRPNVKKKRSETGFLSFDASRFALLSLLFRRFVNQKMPICAQAFRHLPARSLRCPVWTRRQNESRSPHIRSCSAFAPVPAQICR